METGKLSKIVKWAERLGCVDVKQLEELYKDAAYSKLDTILSNDDHPLYNCFQLLPSGVGINISGCRTNHLRDASVGKTINFCNNFSIQ